MLKRRTIGVMMLDTRFPRLPGDIGNPDGFEFDLIYQRVDGAVPSRVVQEQSEDLLQPFIDAGHALVDQGAELVTTSCGFLLMFQTQLQAALSVPVVTSSLLQLGELEAEYGVGNVGILTISASSLDPSFLRRSNIRHSVPIGTTEGGEEFTAAILENRPDFDEAKCREDNVSAAEEIVAAHPNLQALILECTNMPPYASAIETAVGIPVFSLNTLLSRMANASPGQS